MKVKVAVLLGIQGVFEVDVRETSPGVYDILSTLDGHVDIKSSCIAGSTNMAGFPSDLKEKMVRSAEQALATIVGENYKPLDKNGPDMVAVSNQVN